MKTPTKFSLKKLGRRKGEQLLLADASESNSSDFTRIIDRDETRNDEIHVNDDPWRMMPYQMPHSSVNGSKENSMRQPMEASSSIAFSNGTDHKDKGSEFENGGGAGNSRTNKLEPIGRKVVRENKDHRTVIDNTSSMKSGLKASSSEVDIFDDLESNKESVVKRFDSLDDIMADKSDDKLTMPKSVSRKRSIRSFQIDADSSGDSQQQISLIDRESSIESSTRSSSFIDQKYMKKKGILIVDPNKNGEVYRMDEDNKNLTDKELIIIGQGMGGEDDDDDQTMMSSLTEVTYQRSKEERVKYIMKHLKDAASQIPESRTWCNIFECIDGKAQDPKGSTESKTKANEDDVEPSATQNARLFLKSLYSLSLKGVDKEINVGSFSEKIVVCITRIYLSLQEGEQDGGLRCTHNEPKLCHDLGVRLKELSDGQAVVVQILPESTAERSGVKVGDVLSFAVPLNNTFQGYEKACDFISRLELIGMRTSYREIFDMFLSKTSSGWPVATVFRTRSKGMRNFEQLPLGLLSVDMNIDLHRASSFCHEIVTRSREYDYHQESNGVYEIIRGNIESFFPKPECRSSRQRNQLKIKSVDPVDEQAKAFGLNTGKAARAMLLPMLSDENCHQPLYFPENRRSSLLTWYTENSLALLYLKCTATFGGSGIAMTRISEGSWSAPCAIGAKFSGTRFRPGSDPIECIFFIRDVSELDGLKRGEEITLGGDHKRERILVVTKIAGRFCVEKNMLCSCYARNDINGLMYSKLDPTPATDFILNGKVSSPPESVNLGGALRRLELPSTMYPHPTPPNNLLKFNLNDWTIDDSCKVSKSLEAPFDENTISTLKELLQTFEHGESIYEEELNEFNMFAQKFKQMLYDGVTIDRVLPNDTGKQDGDISFSKVSLKMDRKSTTSGREETLVFLEKSGGNRVMSDFKRPMELPNAKTLSETLDFSQIVKISQNMPRSLVKPQTSAQEIKKRRKRYVSMRTKHGKRFMFLARTGKDASLLACGLKLLVERSQRQR